MSVQLMAGVDEAGRGAWCGPVVAAAVILDEAKLITGLADSKVLSPVRRTQLAEEIKRYAMSWAIGSASAREIDEINILQASLLAMSRAIAALACMPTKVIVDGMHRPECPYFVEAVVDADTRIPAVSAASILAKVHRDQLLQEYAEIYPQYGFAQHKGYGTKLHQRKLTEFGVCEIHRRSFAPIRQMLNAKIAR